MNEQKITDWLAAAFKWHGHDIQTFVGGYYETEQTVYLHYTIVHKTEHGEEDEAGDIAVSKELARARGWLA